MRPDPQTRALLDGMAAAGGPALFEMSVAEARAALKEMTRTMDVARAEVRRVEDRHVPGPNGEVTIRIYRPLAGAGGNTLPILMLYHGGGFALGDIETHDNVARFYCARAGVIVINVDYRRSPEHKFPAGVEDCYAALQWAAAHGAELGADPARIAVTGDSAGGNISAVLCHLARDRRGPAIAFQVLAYPVVDLSPAADYASRREFGGGEYFLSQKDVEWINGMYFTDQAREGVTVLASPILVPDLAGLPPALIITAGFDLLRDEGKLYAQRLKSAGVPVESVCFDGTIHGFMSVSGAIDAGREALELVADRLRGNLAC